VIAGLIGFAGVLLVQPGSAAGDIGMIAAASAAICFATTAIFTKRLTRTETITCILFWLTLMQLGIGLIVLPCRRPDDRALGRDRALARGDRGVRAGGAFLPDHRAQPCACLDRDADGFCCACPPSP
jgi:hypothetical protein